MYLAANLSTQFSEGPWTSRVQAAAAFGFGAVEMQWPYADIAAHDLRAALDQQGMKAVLLNAPVGDTPETRLGFASLPGAEDAFTASIVQAVSYASEISAGLVHVVAGTGGERDVLISNLKQALVRLPDGIGFVIEAINRADIEGYHLSSVDDAVSVIEAVGDERLGLMFDFYHVHRNNEDGPDLIRRHAALIRHVQISDAPGRGEPGSGGIDYMPGLTALRELGYTGAVGCEFRPTDAPEDCMAWRDVLGLAF